MAYLLETGKNYTMDVAHKLHELDPDSFTKEKAEKDCRNHLSRLKVDGVIDCIVKGRKNYYKYPS
jgi:hypothetical protein